MTVNNLFCWARTRGFIRIGIPLLLLGSSCALIGIRNPALLNSITDSINQHLTAFRIFRWAALILLIVTWPYLAQKIGEYYQAPPDQVAQWRKETWRIGVWLIIVELLVCDNLITNTFLLLRGT